MTKTKKQKITSAATCVKKVPAALKKFERFLKMLRLPEAYMAEVDSVLDYGGGKYDVFGDELARLSGNRIQTFVYDPYNRSEEHNKLVRQLLTQRPADLAFCNCVLNVIQEKEVRAELLRDIQQLTKQDAFIVFSVYEGDKTGKGKITSKGFQANRKLSSYWPEIKKAFKGTGEAVEYNGLIVVHSRGPS